MGVDISTNGKENIPVYALEDGFVSCVRIEEENTGKCIFIKQNDGFVSVYGHLNQFYDKVEKWIHQKQYKDQKWLLDISFSSTQFPVKKGMLIGYSGNTGHSDAPHLHFEIRDSITGNSINPRTAGILIEDQASPYFNSLYWYDRSLSIYETKKHLINFNIHNLKERPLLVNSPLIGLGVMAENRINGKHHSYGINEVGLQLDGKLIYSYSLKSITENQSRYINACIDYPFWRESGKYVQYLFKLPGNQMKLYKTGNGLLNLLDQKIHQITIFSGQANDFDRSKTIYVKYSPERKLKKESLSTRILAPNQIQKVIERDVELYFPLTCFYDTVPFILKKFPLLKGKDISPRYIFGNIDIPVHDSFTLRLHAFLPSQSDLRKKTLIEIINKNGNTIKKGDWQGNWMSTKTIEFGIMRLIIDTTPPAITMFNWIDNPSIVKNEMFQFRCTDNSGIKDVKAEIDGHWILLCKKNDFYTYHFDEFITKGKHQLDIHVIDIAGNRSSKTLYLKVNG